MAIFQKIVILFSVICSAFFNIVAQEPDSETIKHPIQEVPIGATINAANIEISWDPFFKNTFVAPSPQTGSTTFKEKKSANKDDAQNDLHTSNIHLKSSGSDFEPSISSTIQTYTHGYPNDNEIAVANNGIVVSITNSRIHAYLNNGTEILDVGLGSIFANALSLWNTKFDPRIVYDPIADRFIIVCLNGIGSTESHVLVGFSETSNPAGNWNVYKLSGNTHPTLNTWIDFPQIGISNDELFITGNMFDDVTPNPRGASIWQIELADGYSGDSLTTQLYTTPFFSVHPVKTGETSYGPNFYFLEATNLSFSSSTFYIHEITNTIANNGLLEPRISYSSNTTYAPSPDANQKDTTQLLWTIDTRVLTSYVVDGKIMFALNSNVGGKSGIYIGKFDLSGGLASATVTGQRIEFDSLEVGFPSLAYVGCDSTAIADYPATSLFFNYSSPYHYPGVAAVGIDTMGDVSDVVICGVGTTFLSSNSSPVRWGDYTGSFRRNGIFPPEVWCAGKIADPNGGVWLSKLTFPDLCASSIGILEMTKEDEFIMKTYPNPVVDRVNFEFDVPVQGIYTAIIYDSKGIQEAVLVKERLKKGRATIQFNTHQLSVGTYFMVISAEHNVLTREKFIVTK